MRHLDAVELAKQLVEINSENPPGNEKDISYFIRDYLRDNGFSPKIVRIQRNRYNLVLKLKGDRDGIMLNGHMDTVPIGDDWSYNQGEIKNGRLYGRGAVDMKGGLAALLSAFTKVKEINKTVLVLLTSDEEVNFLGARAAVKNRSLFNGVKYGLIAEPTNFKIQIAQKGILELRYKFFGKSAHGSMPQLGTNAILKANRVMNRLNKYAEEIKKRKSAILGAPTINIGRILGGTKANVVPDYCEFDVDRRIIPEEDIKSVEMEMKNLASGLGDVDCIIRRNPMFLDRNVKLIRVIKQITGAKEFGTSGYTEAELYYTELGIKAVAFGPGDERMSHVVNENIPIRDIKKAEGLYKRIIEAIIA